MTKRGVEATTSEMFNSISEKYDQANRVLSFGIDKSWRKKIIHALPKRPNLRLLDLATGTCDQLLSLMDSGKIAYGLGIDLAEDMIKIGKQKITLSSHADKIELKVANALSIPAQDHTFDCATISFGIRNVEDPCLCLKEMHRILCIGGMAFILEFSLPQNSLIRALHLFYLRHLVPTVGGFLSGQKGAYRYLNQTIEKFPYGKVFLDMMEKAGFVHCTALPLTFGIATLYIGEKS